MYDTSEAKQFHGLQGNYLFSFKDYDVQSSVLSFVDIDKQKPHSR